MKHFNIFALVVVLVVAGHVQLASAQDAAPAKKGDQLEAPQAPQGPGGSNVGLDAAYDIGPVITTDGPPVTITTPPGSLNPRSLEISSLNPGAIFTGFGSDGGGGEVQFFDDGMLSMWNDQPSQQITLQIDPNGNDAGAQFSLWDEGNPIPQVIMLADGNEEGAELRIYQKEGAGARITAQVLGDDGIGGSTRLYVNDAGTPRLTNWQRGDGAAGDIGGRSLLYRKGTGSPTVDIMASESASQGGAMYLRDAAGNMTIELDADFGGDGRVITEELQITGGSDLSENFDITGNFGIAEPLPGMVVSIDPTQTGGLTVSGTPYDRMVAGIVSGAGGIETGLIMAQKGTPADGEFPVALTGRVYVYVDATYGEVKAGDLLTTSATPGHAMKVSDYTQAQGAILGKAMSELTEGRGLVLVLVTLQ